ncbi:MAG: aspartate-semialdehyde dehydrogenase [Candidatus Omnitrophica bacterium]|nr:aspartate-semialdehyde dehydrogenase [Candidatus Omnitrophota bacterium]
MAKEYNVVLVGVGAVGVEMLKVLKQRRFPIKELKVLARSSRDIFVDGEKYSVKEIKPEEFKGCDIALFAGTEGEKGAAVSYAAEAIKNGAVVIDNGADFRMKPEVPLVVPEVNPEDVKWNKGIISNPNCSTIQLVAAIAPIYRISKIRRVVVTTFQAVSGAGRKSQEELFVQSKEIFSRTDNLSSWEKMQKDWFKEKMKEPLTFPYPIAFNLIPQIGKFESFDYTTEEWKMVRETHKIMHDDKIEINATCVRVPVFNVHSESIYLETEKEISIDKIKETLVNAGGIELVDDLDKNAPSDDTKRRTYPLPINASGKDPVYIGRIRQDIFKKNAMSFWCVSDNLRKGAALNAVQIAELVIGKSNIKNQISE